MVPVITIHGSGFHCRSCANRFKGRSERAFNIRIKFDSVSGYQQIDERKKERLQGDKVIGSSNHTPAS